MTTTTTTATTPIRAARTWHAPVSHAVELQLEIPRVAGELAHPPSRLNRAGEVDDFSVRQVGAGDQREALLTAILVRCPCPPEGMLAIAPDT